MFGETGYWPLLLLEDCAFGPAPSIDTAALRARGWRDEDLVTGQRAVELAAGLPIDDAPYCGFPGRMSGARPEVRSVPPQPEQAAILGRGWTGRHGLLLVPAQAPWESLAHIGFSSANESPADTGHVRFHRHLWETCEGVVTAVGHSRMNVRLAKSPQDPVLLADRLFDYCTDLETVLMDFLGADPDEQDFVVLLAGILAAGLPTLPLWWD
jgi:hypothetical protein